MLSNLIKIEAKFIREHLLMDFHKLYIVAFSGGADSTALLLSLKSLGYKIVAAHCNFHLRGAESERDEHFCEELCRREHIELHRIHFDTKAYAELHKVSIEMAARELRYHYFEQLRNDISAEGICVAHHRDDSVETVLLNIIRGTGFYGLTGIAPKNGYILRPLLGVSHQNIINYLTSLNQNFVTDSSNLVDDVQRNKIRLYVIPLMQKVNPAVSENIDKTAQRMTEASKILDAALSKSAQEVCRRHEKELEIDIKGLNGLVSPEYTLWFVLRDYSFSSAQIEQISHSLGSGSGRKWLSKTHICLINRGKILVSELRNDDFSKKMKIPEMGIYIFSDVKFKITIEDISSFVLDKSKNSACFDAEKVKFPLLIRYANNGDKFVPFGMIGVKLLSDYMTDRKFSVLKKQIQLVVCNDDGDIIWLVGERPDNRFRITSDTQKILKITI